MSPADRIQLIHRSLRVFVCGWLSLIPVIGLIPALYAFFAGGLTRAALREEWNPAASYLLWGRTLAVFSFIISILAAAIFILQLI